MKTTLIATCLGLLLAVSGPASVAAADDDRPRARDCRDGLDNDGDGTIDRLDPGCLSRRDSSEYGTVACDDGSDNDQDGLADFADNGCTSSTDASEFGTTECDDGTDNDGDGNIDFAVDAGCANAADPTEATTEWYAGPALWDAPESRPHPAFGWATLSQPPAGELPDWWEPVPAASTPAAISGLEHVAAAPAGLGSGWDTVSEGAAGWDVAVFGSIAVVPGAVRGEEYVCPKSGDGGSVGRDFTAATGLPPPWSGPAGTCADASQNVKQWNRRLTAVLDISDPEAPELLSAFLPTNDGWGLHNQAAIIAYPDGRLVAVLATGSAHDLWDITDPTHPVSLGVLKWVSDDTIWGPTSFGAAVIPGTPIVFNLNRPSAGTCVDSDVTPPEAGEPSPCGLNEMYDLSDPMAPVQLPAFADQVACHDITFWSGGDAYYGVCAGIQNTQLWDLADPYHPRVIMTLPAPVGISPLPGPGGVNGMALNSNHAGLSADGRVLYVADTTLQGGGPPGGCTGEVRTAEGSVSPPLGAVWFYDVADPAHPNLLGWYSAAYDPLLMGPNAICAPTHVALVPDPAGDRDTVAVSFHGAGVVLLDFAPLRSGGLPVVLDQWADGSDTVRTVYNNGYLVTGDRARGFDVLSFT